MIKETELNKLVEKFLTGKCTDDEYKQLEEWFSSFDDRKANVISNQPLNKQELKIKLLTRIENELIGEFKEETRIIPRRSHKAKMLTVMGSVAAAACLLLTVNVYLFKAGYFHDSSKILYRELITKSGETTRFKLEDGSVVWLNSGSSLRYPLKFTGDKRELFLSGEAFFDIHHEKARSFIVHSGKITTQDIGTSFDIKAFSGSLESKVTVLTGKVKVYPEARENRAVYKDCILNGGQGLTYNLVNHTTALVPADRNIANWRSGGLCFDNESLSTIACQLENRFNLKISFQNDEIKSMKFSGLFTSSDTINKILNIIGKADRIQLKKNGTHIYFYTNKNVDRTP